MGNLDFGMAMVKARFAGREIKKPSEESKREAVSKANPPDRDDVEKRKFLILRSWLKKPHRERILLPSDPPDREP
jgi:hypothetical protein